jgi:hypothetical protein
VRVASLEDLLAMKRAAGRPQDDIDVESLEIARSRLRGRRRFTGPDGARAHTPGAGGAPVARDPSG